MADITYTPNGVARAKGYYDRNNPFDTGRAGERNSELGGGKNTMAGWDYERGQARPGATMASDGVWHLPGGNTGGGGGGGGISGSIYGGMAAIAQKSFDTAKARIGSERLGTRQNYGFNTDGSQLDGLNFLGKFQQYNRSAAGVMESAREEALGRGLGGKGLGGRVSNMPRYDLDVAANDMSRGYQGILSGLDQQELSASEQLQRDLMEARMAQMQYDMDNWGGGWGDDGGGEDGPLIDDVFAPLGKVPINKLMSLATRYKSKQVAKSPKALSKYGWGAAAVMAKATGKNKPTPIRSKPAPRKPKITASNPYATGQRR